MKTARPRRREPLFAAVFLLITALLLQLASAVLRPPHTDYGSTWAAYRREPKNTIDVLYLGSSYAYCDINPALVYEHSGLTGYVMGGSEQTFALTYWYLKEALRTQTPQAVVIEATGLFFQPYQNYTQVNVGYMPFSLNKLGAIFSHGTEEDLRLGLLFDLYFYHDRWKELTPGRVVQALTPVGRDDLKGHTAVDKVLEHAGDAPTVADRDISPQVYRQNLADLARVLALCRARGIQAVLTVNPTYTQCTQETYAKAMADVAELDPTVRFYNWSDRFAEVGLDPARHLYDGWHLNQDGAAVFSGWLGTFLKEELGLVPMAQSAGNTAAWTGSVAFWRTRLAH